MAEMGRLIDGGYTGEPAGDDDDDAYDYDDHYDHDDGARVPEFFEDVSDPAEPDTDNDDDDNHHDQ